MSDELTLDEIDHSRVPFGHVTSETEIIDAGGGVPLFEAYGNGITLTNNYQTVDEWWLSITTLRGGCPYGTVGKKKLSPQQAAWVLAQITDDCSWDYVEW